MSGIQRTGYEAARPTHVCAASGRGLEPGERYVATLVETPVSDELIRMDYSLAAWEAGRRPDASRRLVAVWRTHEAERSATRSPLLGDEELSQLFEGMEASAEGRAAVFRYLLALLLLRRRVYRVRDQRRGEHGRPVLQLVRRGGPKHLEPEVHEVVDPGMDEEAIAAGIEELGIVLAGDDGDGRGGA